MSEHAKMQLPWTGIIATDSLSLLDTLFGHDATRREKEHDEPINLSGLKIVLNCVAPDWDVRIEIQESLAQLPQLKLQHVKGHQDRTRAYNAPTQLEQLNVDADAKASFYQNNHGATRPLVLMMNHTKAHLLGPEGTVTSQYAEYLWFAATASPLKEYIQRRNEWNEQIMSSINWEPHRLALKKQNKKCTHLTKLVFNILPTMSQINKFDNGR